MVEDLIGNFSPYDWLVISVRKAEYCENFTRKCLVYVLFLESI